MCLIIHKPIGLTIAGDVVANAWERNHDSWGLMWAEEGKISIHRSLDFGSLKLALADPALAEKDLFLHLRKRTRGNIDLLNAHPYRISEDLWLMHNGTLEIECPYSEFSDTWHLAKYYLTPILERNPQLLESKDFERLIASFIGPDNRLVFLRSDGYSLIVNRQAGIDLMGLWLSNTYAWDAARWLEIAS